MPNNPVQVVLNTSDYLIVPENGGYGPPKDFNAGRNEQFVKHRNRLAKQASSISDSLKTAHLESGFVKVTLSEEAWAKSHRPTRALFPPSSHPCVGAAGLGELFFMVTPSGLDEVTEQIELAEAQPRTRRNEKTGKIELIPSYRRSEVGAIESISLPGPEERREFDLPRAIRWLSDARTSGSYLVEFHDLARVSGSSDPDLRARQRRAVERFFEELRATELSIDLYALLKGDLNPDRGTIPRTLGIRLSKAAPGLHVMQSTGESRSPEFSPFDDDLRHHRTLLAVLDRQPLVQRVMLPPLVQQSETNPIDLGKRAELPKRKAKGIYPKVGVIDGGISDILSEWIVGRSDLLDPTDVNPHHGSFIAGLLVAGQALNDKIVATERDGCELYDASVFPDRNKTAAFQLYYPSGAKGFLEEVANAIAAAKERFGIRVFNMSINMQSPVEEERYSPFAERLDEIADENDVLLIVSAGNLKPADQRAPWPASVDEALKQLAERASPDTVFVPCESSRVLAVGAVSTPNTPPHVVGTPACYTRRGPGLKVGVKPDLAHYGGCPPIAETKHCGLFSVDGFGNLVSSLGTSYAAPLVAKSVAALESRIQGYVTREALIALTVHHANVPDSLKPKKLADVARQFVGFGIPSSTDEVLVTADHEITLVFSDTLSVNQELHFDFPWPRCLVDRKSGNCRGNIRMTLVYRPPLNGAFGAEFVRVNLDAHLRQEDADGHFRGQLKQVALPKGSGTKREAELIKHGLKWWPIKAYERKIPVGIGVSSNWQLAIDSVTRAGELYPSAGVPFTVVLSIADPDQDANVFTDLRQILQARRVTMSDIHIAGRIRPRVS